MASLAALLGLLAAADVVRSVWVPGGSQFAFNGALLVAVVAIARMARLGLGELGLDRRELGSGLRWGAAAFACIAAAVTVAAILAPGRFDDDRAEVGIGALVVRAMIVIPIGTVVLEELAFRGALLGMLQRVTSAGWAIIASSVMFGLWHVPGADGVSGVEVAGTVVATTIAGVFLAWLRVRSGSLVAPALAHVALNSVAFTATWIVHRA